MGKAFDHIVQELENISPQEKQTLRELLNEQLTGGNGARESGNTRPAPAADDPLAGLRASTGITDLAERFDDYRFGRKTP